MRLIDADRLLTERMKSKYYHLPNGDIAIPIIDIEHAPTIESKCGEWIPCKERLPEADGLYLATFTLIGIPKFSNVESFKNGKWEYHNGYIIAWQPLPKPWKGVNNDRFNQEKRCDNSSL